MKREIYFCFDFRSWLSVTEKMKKCVTSNNYYETRDLIDKEETAIITSSVANLSFDLFEKYRVFVCDEYVTVELKPGMVFNDGTVIHWKNGKLLDLLLEHSLVDLQDCKIFDVVDKPNRRKDSMIDFDRFVGNVMERLCQKDNEMYRILQDSLFEQGLVYEGSKIKKAVCVEKSRTLSSGDDCETCEPVRKFNTGDWIVSNSGIRNIVKILKVVDNDSFDGTGKCKYVFSGSDVEYEQDYVEQNYHLWSIDDAVAGDVISLSSYLIVFKEKIDDELCKSFFTFDRDSNLSYPFDKSNFNINGCRVCPATEGEKSLLEAKMKNGGYAMSEDKTQLLSIKPHKFEFGDWIVYDTNDGNVSTPRQITGVGIVNGCYLLDVNKKYPFDEVDKMYRKWNYDDIKDGDFLCAYELGKPKTLFVKKDDYKNIGGMSYQFAYSCDDAHGSISGKGFPVIVFPVSDVRPADKEQKETILREIENAGYQWDAAKKRVIPKTESEESTTDKHDEEQHKFSVGDWVVGFGKTLLIVDISKDDDFDGYVYKFDGGFSLATSVLDDFRLWDQNYDIKDGDFLCSDENGNPQYIFIASNSHFDGCGYLYYCRYCIQSGAFETEDGSVCLSDEMSFVHPATPEQRKLLLDNISLNGYKWDDDAKKLSSIKMKTPEESLGISSQEYASIVDECIYGDDWKFKAGDWIVDALNFKKEKVVTVSKDTGYFLSSGSEEWWADKDDVEEYYHLWSIDDLMPFDAVVCVDGDERICLYKRPNDDTTVKCYGFVNISRRNSEFELADKFELFHTKGMHPATDEQERLLNKKMNEAGYVIVTKDGKKKLMNLVDVD